MTEHEWPTSGSGSGSVQGDEIDLRIAFDSFESVLEHFRSRISEEGVVVQSSARHEVGAKLSFLVGIRAGFPVLEGTGEVTECRTLSDAGTPAFELVLRYLTLGGPSVKLLPRLIEHYRKRGVPLLELPAMAAPPPEEPPQSQPKSKPLTLADLEAELMAPAKEDEGGGVEAAVQADPPAEADQVPELEVEDDLISLEDTGSPIAVETLPDPTDDEEIRVEELMPSGELEIDSGVLELVEDLEGPPEDPGLPWLPDESMARDRSDMWMTLTVAIVVGVLLAVGFYYFVLRQPASTSIEEPPPSRTQIQTPNPARSETGREPALEIAAPGELERADGGPLTRIDRITWDASDRETVVVLWADGRFDQDRFEALRVEADPPREVVKVIGVSEAFPEERLEIASRHVRQLRTAIHAQDDRVELHVVADLADPAVALQRTEADGSQLRVFFSHT